MSLLEKTARNATGVEWDIHASLRALGAAPDDTVLVHASFSRLSRKGHRARAVIERLMGYLGAGTLAMPAMSWRAVNPENPVFDEMATPSITGVLSEVFRKEFATHRSLHPTHSVAAAGTGARDLTASHHRDPTPCGPSSPWHRLLEEDALVVMLGVGMDTCTLVHCLEEAVAPATYLRDEVESYTCRDRTGNEHRVCTRRHRKLMRNFWKFEDMLRAAGSVQATDADGTPAFAFRARELQRLGMDHMRTDALGTLAGPGERGKLM